MLTVSGLTIGFFRCRNESDESAERFVEIQNVAVALRSYCEKRRIPPDLDLDVILDRLCWLADNPRRRQGWDNQMRWEHELPHSGLNLFSAIACFGCVSLVKDPSGKGNPM